MDISKAFATVPHSAIKPVLAREGIPTTISDIISEMYRYCKISIRAKNNEGVEIGILRGVKQGDSLSPLFNLCMEPLLDEIEEKTGGVSINDRIKAQVLTFADDIVLLSEDERETQCQVDMLYK
jgi:hypothetical protein